MNSKRSGEMTTATTPPPPIEQQQRAVSQLLGGVWSEVEHNRFLEAMQLYPQGPWKDIADHVATRSVRQVQTHAQKYHEKVARRMRGLRKERKKLLRPEHRIDDDMMNLCRELENERLLPSASLSSSSISSSSVRSGLSRFADARPRLPDQWSQQQQHSVHGSALHRLSSYEQRGLLYLDDQHNHHHYHCHHHHRHSEPHIAIFSQRDSTYRPSDPQHNDYNQQHTQRHTQQHNQHHNQPYHHDIDAYPHDHQHHQQHGTYDPKHTEQQQQTKDAFVPALVEPTARAIAAHRSRHDLPSFHDCLDFLIDVFGSRECNDATWYRQHVRR